MNRNVIRGMVLGAVFLLSLLFFGFMLNREAANTAADMGNATLPEVMFEVDGHEINPLVGYVDEMDVTAMRDTIVPVTSEGSLNVLLKGYGEKIESFAYEVYPADGSEMLMKGKVKKIEETVTLDLKKALDDNSEKVLRIKLGLSDGRSASYYTRITSAIEYNVKDCLNFADDFHGKTFEETEGLASYMEPSSEGDHTTLQTVTLHSNVQQLMWGDMEVEVVGEIRHYVKETNETYTGVLLDYQVQETGENGNGTRYHVREYLKVRYHAGRFYLLDYDRTMNERFRPEERAVTEEGIVLGMTAEDVNYLSSEKGGAVAFVQERELYTYVKKENRFALVFSFEDAESEDVRNRYDQHDIKLISVEENGSAAFGVYGYMNRGVREGEVGASIYYYDSEKNVVEEIAFIPSNKSFAIAKDTLGKFVYYHRESNLLYVMVDGAFYRIDLNENVKETIVQNLSEEMYVASEDGRLFAYADGNHVNVWNLETGKAHTVTANEGEAVRPLGFVNSDFLCGRTREADAGKTASGADITPMYRMEIYNDAEKLIKEYEAADIFIKDIMIEDNMLTLGRVQKSGDVYQNVADEYISNNAAEADEEVTAESYQDERKGKQMRLSFGEKLSKKAPKLLQPNLARSERPMEVSFDMAEQGKKYYVHGKGKVQGVYDKAGHAITKADEVSGVVVTSKQAYVWERGNRLLRYQIGDMAPVTAGEGETTLAACVRAVAERNGQSAEELEKDRVDLSGCTVEQMFYIIGRGTPVIAMTGTDTAVLLVGYDESTVTYMDPAGGTKSTVSIETMEALVSATGNTMFGYIK